MKKSFLYTFVVLGVFAIFMFQLFAPVVEAQTPPPAQTTPPAQTQGGISGAIRQAGTSPTSLSLAGLGYNLWSGYNGTPSMGTALAGSVAGKIAGVAVNETAKLVVIPTIQWIALSWLKAIQFGMFLTGMMFDSIVNFTTDDQSLILGFKASIGSAWKIIRDLANISIVFSLLYLGIKTILNGNGFAEVKVLVSILLAAVLINFSLVFTETVFNISNVIGNQIGQQIIFTGQSTGYSGVKSISAGLMGMIRPDNVMALLWNKNPPSMDWIMLGDQVQSAIFTGIIMLFLAVIFIGASILLMYRFIIFIVLMITSPIGLISKLIPWFNKAGDWWWNTLKSQAIVLPAFMLTLYISILFVSPLSSRLLSGVSFGVGNVQTPDTAYPAAMFIFYFLLIIGFLLLPLIVPGRIGAAGSSMMTNVADWTTKKIKSLPRSSGRLAGRAALSGTARTGRIMGRGVGNLIGGAEGSDRRRKLQLKAQDASWRGMFARRKLSTSEGLKNQTYDIRSTKLGGKFGMGKGIESWNKSVDSQKKKLEERQKREEKLFGFDGKNISKKQKEENRIALVKAEAERDVHADIVSKHNDAVKKAQIEFNKDTTNKANEKILEDAITAKIEAQSKLEEHEKKVGEAKNPLLANYIKLIENRSNRFYNSFDGAEREAVSKVGKDLDKKLKEEGKAKQPKKKENSTTKPTATQTPPPLPTLGGAPTGGGDPWADRHST